MCISVKEGAHTKIGHVIVNKKELITPDILKKIVIKYGQECNNLIEIRICCMCRVSYAGFLRFSEMVNLKRSDLKFSDSHVSLLITKSKTDHYREGTQVLIARTDTQTCPVSMLGEMLIIIQY